MGLVAFLGLKSKELQFPGSKKSPLTQFWAKKTGSFEKLSVKKRGGYMLWNE